MSMEKVSEIAGVSAESIRYYEKIYSAILLNATSYH
ncbi:MerR family transcriptional regulator [Aerococcus urinaeequi]